MQQTRPGASIQHQEVIPVPAPFHGPDSPISTPTQRDEEGEEEEQTDDDVVEENPPGINPSLSTQEREQTAEGATSTVHTAEGTTTAWVSVVDFNGNLSTLHEHEAAINAMAADWLDQAQQPIRDASGGWGEVNHSEPPYYGIHAPSRVNKQPKDGDKPPDHQFDDESFDLLRLDADDKQGRDGSGEQSGTSSEEQTTSTGRSYKKRDDGMVYRQPDNPTRWSRRSGELPAIPEQKPPGEPADGEKEAPAPEGGHSQGGGGEAVSYYNPENRKFRRREGHGPQRVARKQRIWDDWLSWRDAWRAENRGETPEPDREVGAIETQGGRTNETSLVRAIAGEIHSVARHLLHQRQLEDEGDQLQRGTKRLSAAEVVQWERHLADNEQEEEDTATTMMETGGEEPSEEGSQDSTPDSHRRRRLLAAHHKDFIVEDGRKSDDENCLMAMGRYDSNSSSQEEVPPANDAAEAPAKEDTAHRAAEEAEDVEAAPREEDTNLDDELRHRLIEGNAVPDPEITASMGRHNNVELEHFAAGLQRQLIAHIRWLRTNRAFWGSLQRSLVHELQVSLNAGAILQWMVSQAMLYARGMAPPNRAYVEDPYPPLNPGEAARASHRLVFEITIHCDILGRLMQSFSGESIAHDERVREHLAHLARMESSPIRSVRQRTEVGPWNATVTSRGSTTSSTAVAPPENNQSAATERQHQMGQVAQTHVYSDCQEEQEPKRRWRATRKRLLLIKWRISETGPGVGEKMMTTRSLHYRTSGTICYAILWGSRLPWKCGALRMLLILGKTLLAMGHVARLAYRETPGGPPRRARQQQ